ncbi:hypothetical protein ACVWW1_002252 [Bradyrhizobium sp. JR3.5]
MTELQRLLVRGSEKIIGHYQFLLDTAKSELYSSEESMKNVRC